MSQLPPEFDPGVYRAFNPDLMGMTQEQQAAHYQALGRTEGRSCSTVTHRAAFQRLVRPEVAIVEIGPYTAPAFRRPAYNVRYFDAFSTAELKAKASSTGMDPSSIPEIDYVWTGRSYAELVREPVQAVYSAHNIEHQPDLIRHLQQVAALLQDDGLMFLTIPDRRYCFDHFLPDSTFADAFSAYYDRRIRHVAGHVFEHAMLTTHNEVALHWRGDHGEPPLARAMSADTRAAIMRTRAVYETTAGYIDTHAWQFTPHSFRHLIEALAASGLIELRIERLYPTVHNSNEFYVVLGKVPA